MDDGKFTARRSHRVLMALCALLWAVFLVLRILTDLVSGPSGLLLAVLSGVTYGAALFLVVQCLLNVFLDVRLRESALEFRVGFFRRVVPYAAISKLELRLNRARTPAPNRIRIEYARPGRKGTHLHLGDETFTPEVLMWIHDELLHRSPRLEEARQRSSGGFQA